MRVEEDLQVRALLDAGTPVVCLVAKSDVRHVREALRTTLEENLAILGGDYVVDRFLEDLERSETVGRASTSAGAAE